LRLNRSKLIGGLAIDRKLKDCCSLATSKQRHQNLPSIREFECIVMLIAEVRVNGAKSGHAEASVLGPNPSVVEFNVFIEGQFGPGKEAYRYLPIVLSGKPAR
jgi:hypothetical protein